MYFTFYISTFEESWYETHDSCQFNTATHWAMANTNKEYRDTDVDASLRIQPIDRNQKFWVT